ncbi:AAA family ATPase [Citromicrobium sp. WPS32]|uniref:AAA family ATPase n=1 Tax=Citromicrobium sp. WPS32 TaxID=1634517 RepID=UPI0006C935F2|nr:AAA family ATPase [Citromicrobium sp. WPS32]|tara:strand:- start:250 stop:1323 length:1074 start_codon:yes stop_codon:yes gene_type:complete
MDRFGIEDDIDEELADAYRDNFQEMGGQARRQRGAHKRQFEPQIISAAALAMMEFPAIKYVVPGYIAEGLTILAGKPKIGKSWLVLETAIAVAESGTCLGGIECEQGDVLYLALEDNRRRLLSRLRKLGPTPERLHLATEWARANEGGVDALRTWIEEHPNARYVVIDVLAMFRAAKGRDQSLYDADYAAVKELQSLAMETGVAIVVVTHTRKSAAENDPFEKVSGTLGISGGADAVLILDRDQNGVTLYGRGRDIEEIETAVTFDRETCRWVALGDPGEVRMGLLRSEIIRLLQKSAEPMGPTELAKALDYSAENVRQTLPRMVKAGEIEKSGRGKYLHPDNPLSQQSQCHKENME